MKGNVRPSRWMVPTSIGPPGAVIRLEAASRRKSSADGTLSLLLVSLALPPMGKASPGEGPRHSVFTCNLSRCDTISELSSFDGRASLDRLQRLWPPHPLVRPRLYCRKFRQLLLSSAAYRDSLRPAG